MMDCRLPPGGDCAHFTVSAIGDAGSFHFSFGARRHLSVQRSSLCTRCWLPGPAGCVWFGLTPRWLPPHEPEGPKGTAAASPFRRAAHVVGAPCSLPKVRAWHRFTP